MEGVMKKFQHLKIQLEEITSAINFDDNNNCIGGGGFGRVYKGEVSHSKGRSMVAIKRLDRNQDQGDAEFLKEIDTLSRYSHKNLISLLGFCYEGAEAILVYEIASRGSLDKHLDSGDLTWSQRLNICLGAAEGLKHLHDPKETHQRLIHCDVKSGNILLDDNWNAKVADFGFSIMGPANEQNSTIITLAAGTRGYCDPQYEITNTLTKESDVYSLGVVLVEVLCGALCYTYNNDSFDFNLVPTWKDCYEKNKLNDIIFKHPTIQPLDQSALEIFSDIVYRCLEVSREDRPNMAEVVTELDSALKTQELINSQEFSEWKAKLSYYEEITKTAEPPLNFRSKVEFIKLLYKGVLLNGGKTWFLLNKNGEHCEMISFGECLVSDPRRFDRRTSAYNSRFAVPTFTYNSGDGSVKTHVKTQFLSVGITYTVNLVFKMNVAVAIKPLELILLPYKLEGESKTSISYFACERDDGWWMCELYQFTSEGRIVDLEIVFDSFYFMQAEGIEFRPLEKVGHKDFKQHILDSDAEWEEKLPTDYEKIMKWSENRVHWTTKKEAYSILCKGFLINDGQEWFSLDKNGKKCHFLSARAARVSAVFGYGESGYTLPLLSFPESRFGEVFTCDATCPTIDINIQSELLSFETAYAGYLVYKLQTDQSMFEAPMEVNEGSSFNKWYIYFVSPQTPVIKPKAGQNTHNPLNRPEIQGLPQQRNDGWMQVPIGVFFTGTTPVMIPSYLKLKTCGGKLSGLIIEGIEFRPI